MTRCMISQRRWRHGGLPSNKVWVEDELRRDDRSMTGSHLKHLQDVQIVFVANTALIIFLLFLNFTPSTLRPIRRS